jgi:hypothetical protein
MTKSTLSDRDLEMLKTGRSFERLDIIKDLEKQASKMLKSNPEHALHIGFIVQQIKSLEVI